MLVERTYTQTTESLDATNTFLEVWDGGSRRYERWPDGTECSWEVVSNDTLETDMKQVLRELPLWDTPAVVMWYEKVPVLKDGNTFQIPGWSVSHLVVPEERTQKPEQVRYPQGPQGLHGHKRQPDAVANQNVNRRYFSKKRPHMGSGPRERGMDGAR